MVLVASSIGVGARGGPYACPQGKLFRAPSTLTLACRRGACGAFAAAGICDYFPLRERMLVIMALRPYAGELWDYSPLCRHSTSLGHSIGSTQDQLSLAL
jgi:hypothetical protein